MLIGGADVTPSSYGADPHHETVHHPPGPGRAERRLLDGRAGPGLPVLGVCRGAQLLNVALGGTLHQHLPDVARHTPATCRGRASSGGRG